MSEVVKTRRYSEGLTLVELMTVLAVLALSLLLAAPSIGQYLEDRKVRNVAESLFYGMQKARWQAVQTNIQTRFVWSGAGWTVSQLDMATLTPITPPLETFDWGVGGNNNWSSVSVAAVSGGATLASAAVTFDGMGRVVFPESPAIPPPNRFDVSGRSGSRAFRVVVDGGGGVRVCDPQLPSSDPKGCK
ncbi:MAG: GspH/FimT family pseudopilin [Proteobacteria bacterium]|nr:GspH/FimT family pseudopilin [Pseudomonadota bacterium]MCL2306895.1 GspH/FimT family pseudopilin [Pseudomonadota bacterium]